MIRIPTSATLSLGLVAVLGLSSPAAAQGDAGQSTVVGESTCAVCHGELAEQFGLSVHSRLRDFELNGHASRCEACHGPGSMHAESADPQFIYSFRDKEAREASKACVGCHYQDKAGEWPGSVHMMSGLSCSDCHTIHQSGQVSPPSSRPLVGTATRNPGMGMVAAKAAAPPRTASLTKPEPELCFDCHQDKRAQVNRSSHHPIIEGRMECSSCHTVHGGEDRLLASHEEVNELCSGCHASYQGPFVFEHEAVEEGCDTCHNPHGAVANNLLKQNEPFLCLQCHEAHFHIGREGISDPIVRATGSVTNQYGAAGWRRAFTTKCTVCHSQVHGTDLPSQSLTGQGGALTR